MNRFFSLLWIRFWVGFWEFREFIAVVFLFWRQRNFCLQDLNLLRQYLFQNPFRICKRFLVEKGVTDPYVYGETPLTTWDSILKRLKVTQNDTLFELGCGRGRTCFFAECFYDCHVVGCDFVKTFIEKAQKAALSPNLKFVLGDFTDLPFEKATIIYLYGSAMSESEIASLILALKKSQTKAKIVTVSFPLDSILVIDEFEAVFPWGETTIYVQKNQEVV